LKLENLTITNALQLEAAEPRQPFPALITTPRTPYQVLRRCTYPLPFPSVL